MGSGATKIDSNQSVVTLEREKSGLSVLSEKNNNVIAKSSSSALRPKLEQQEVKKSKDDIGHRTLIQKLPDLQPLKPKDTPSETKIISLKSTPLEPIKKENEKEKSLVARLNKEPIKKENEKEQSLIARLNKELAASESQRLDLEEQIQLLEEKLMSKGQQQQTAISSTTDSLQETLNAKDQYILKLEKESKANQAEANKLRLKLKKRIKALTNQLHETRQESSISQMELKAKIAQQAEQMKSLKGQSPSSSSPQEEINTLQYDQDHSKIIVELSNQLSEQSEQIASLETELSEKKKEISDLKLAISEHYDAKDSMSSASPNPHSSLLPQTSTDRLHSSRGRRVSKPGERTGNYKTHSYNNSFATSPTPVDEDTKSSFQLMHRQSTTLSDSDSDWGDNPTPSHIHSAPARSRVKSAVSITSSGKRKGSLVTLNGNDDSIMDLVSASPIDPSLEQREVNKKSTLKNHLEKTRIKNQENSLIGPSLAFEKKADPFSDTSCEPTPRPKRTMLHTDPKVRIVKPIVH